MLLFLSGRGVFAGLFFRKDLTRFSCCRSVLSYALFHELAWLPVMLL